MPSRPSDSKAPLVLVVDDDPDFLLVVRELLEACGYQSVPARDGKEALEVLAKRPVSIVMTDLFMPHMDGLELIRRLRKRDHQPIVVVTGAQHLAVEATTAAARALGAHGVLIKPFSKDELERALTDATARAAADSTSF